VVPISVAVGALEPPAGSVGQSTVGED
jgi:hypothetical protein